MGVLFLDKMMADPTVRRSKLDIFFCVVGFSVIFVTCCFFLPMLYGQLNQIQQEQTELVNMMLNKLAQRQAKIDRMHKKLERMRNERYSSQVEAAKRKLAKVTDEVEERRARRRAAGFVMPKETLSVKRDKRHAFIDADTGRVADQPIESGPLGQGAGLAGFGSGGGRSRVRAGLRALGQAISARGGLGQLRAGGGGGGNFRERARAFVSSRVGSGRGSETGGLGRASGSGVSFASGAARFTGGGGAGQIADVGIGSSFSAQRLLQRVDASIAGATGFEEQPGAGIGAGSRTAPLFLNAVEAGRDDRRFQALVEELRRTNGVTLVDCGCPHGRSGGPGSPGPAGLKGRPGGNGNDGNPGQKGNDGIPGEKGPDGLQGPPGPPGAAGQPGGPGKRGSAGKAGPVAAAGKDGQNGADGIPGLPGADGNPGEDGTPGENGAPGQDGLDGAPGQPGQPGSPGSRGSAGPKGPDGNPGGSGNDGSPGADGAPGGPGPDGNPGNPGNLGAPGDAGAPGRDGAAGRPGSDGQPGRDGFPGRDGSPGAEGNPGPTGPPGADGQPGNPGKDGERGKDGSPGRPGKDGKPGNPGSKGFPGQPGSDGSSGKPGAAGRDGQPGRDGFPGQDGRNGEDGKPGKTGSSGRNGKDGAAGERGADGQPGAPGNAGFDGKAGEPGRDGAPGQDGEPGAPGADGRPGAKGPDGPPGDKGEPGAPGDPGRDGRTGNEGRPGADGQTGSPGGRGAPGDAGFPGKDGEQGEAGAPGRDGEAGTPGPAGRDGTPGLHGTPGKCITQCKADARVMTLCGGSYYHHWGSKTCSDSNTRAQIVYTGFIAGGNYADDFPGGGHNYLCLPENPENRGHIPGFSGPNNTPLGGIYGAVYRLHSKSSPFVTPIGVLQGQQAVCAVCYTFHMCTHVMIPALKECPRSMIKEYSGYLMALSNKFSRSQYICVDKKPDASYESGNAPPGGGSGLFVVEVKCGALPCSIYPDGREIACVVCGK